MQFDAVEPCGFDGSIGGGRSLSAAVIARSERGLVKLGGAITAIAIGRRSGMRDFKVGIAIVWRKYGDVPTQPTIFMM